MSTSPLPVTGLSPDTSAETGRAVLVRDDGRTARLKLSGEFDVAALDGLHATLSTWLDRGRHRLDLDLSGVRFLDVTCAELLLAVQLRFAAEGRELLARSANRQVRRVFRLAGIGHVLLDR